MSSSLELHELTMSRIALSLALMTLAFEASTAWANESSEVLQSRRVLCDAVRRCAIIQPKSGELGPRNRHWLVMGLRGRSSRDDSPCAECNAHSYGRLFQSLLQWTDHLVRRIDRLGVIQPPWIRDTAGTASEAASTTSGPRIMARVRPVRIRGGYGVEARVYF